MNTGESSGSRWFVGGVTGAVLSGALAATAVLSPVPRTLAHEAIGRITATVAPAKHAGPKATRTSRPSSTVPGPLNGEPTSRAAVRHRPIAVTIDNYYPDARPQSGVSQASVVFETLVEGGYTRLMAVYLEHTPRVVGPVRSTRIYFDDWAGAYHAIISHVGGNDDADAQLWEMRSVYNMDQGGAAFMMTNSNPYYWRTSARQAPDNMYTNIANLRAYAAKRGQDWRYGNASLLHKQPASFAQRGAAGTLSISFVDPNYPSVPSNPDYQVQYRYVRASNTYLRVVGGKTDVDAASHTSIRASNVVVLQTGPGTADLAAGTTVDAVSIPVIGSGSATYYLDGRVQHGTWRQKDPLAPLQLLTSHGTPMQLNPGQTWIDVLPKYSTATWTTHL